MIFYYIRHGDPIYNPDSLTEFGKKQADALAKRLALYGIDKIYASTSNRAIMTAQPTADLLGLEIEQLDFCNENHAWREMTLERDGVRLWISDVKEIRELFCQSDVLALGDKWYEHPEFTAYKKGCERIRDASDEFFKSLGYEHINGTGRYKVIKSNDERVALFAHSGFARNFFSNLLDIPYPVFSMHFDICTSGMTVIEFEEEENGYAVPRILTFSSDSHIYREGLPTKYNKRIYF